MTDQQIIDNAYEESIKRLYLTFYGEYVVAPDRKTQAAAEKNFRNGFKLAREARDRATASVPP